MPCTSSPRAVLRTWSGAFVLLLFASSAAGTVLVPDVLIRGVAPVDRLAPGEAFALPIDIYVADGVVLEQVGIQSDRPEAVEPFDAELMRAPVVVPPGYTHHRRMLRGVLEEGLDAIRIQVTAGGEVWEERLSLRSFGDDDATPTPVALGRAVVEEDRLDPERFTRPDPAPSGFPVAEPRLGKAARSVTVTGRILMTIAENPAQRGVDGATVYLMQRRVLEDDLELGRTTTDVNGDFELITMLDGAPDVYVKVRSVNSAANVGTNLFFETYGRNFSYRFGFTGTTINVGSRAFEGDINHALWLLTMFTRQHRYFEAVMGWDLPQTNCRWIDDVLGSSCYLPIPGMEGIHLRSSATWEGSTVLHEYGHHVVHRSPIAEIWPPLYTNGVCDPGHCGTCPENPQVAWSEGVPHFLQATFAGFHRDIYGWNVPNWESVERVFECTESGIFGEDPDSTEDFISALLWDLIDSNPDGSSLAPGIEEFAEFTIQDVLDAAISSYASNTFKFLDGMREYLQQPQFTAFDRREFWAAAAVNGLAVDTTPPTPSTITVPTHPIGMVAATNVPTIYFSIGTDDASGVEQHRIEIAGTAGSPGPGAILFHGLSLSWPTPLAEGTYWINYTSLDRAGNESVASSYGPFSVGPPSPLDLALYQPGLWEDEFLLRHDTSVTASAGAIETQVLPETDAWLSMSSANVTLGSATVPPFWHSIQVDGVTVTNDVFAPGTMLPGAVYQILNAGPIQLSGGRHHIQLTLDQDHDVPEINEANTFDRFVVVRPPVLAPGAWQTNLPPPPTSYTAGSSGFQAHPNRSGYRIAPQNVYAAVTMVVPESGTDHRLSLHPASVDHQTGFGTPIVISDTRGGEPETIVVNKNHYGANTFDIGVERMRVEETGVYSLRHVSSVVLGSGDVTNVSWQAGDLISLIEYQFNGLFDTGTTSIVFDVNFHPSDPLHELELYWLEPSQGTLRPHQVQPDLLITSNGRHVLEIDVPSGGRYCLVAYRPVPADMLAWPMSFSANMQLLARPDLVIDRAREFWDLPLLPSSQPIQGPGAPAPEELIGNGFSTYLNYAIRNQGQVPAGAFEVTADVDGITGQQFFWSQQASLGAGATATFFDTNPIYVEGGRHTIVMRIDAAFDIEENNEQNNLYAAQFGWSGPELLPSMNVTMDTPPDPTAGQQLIEVVQREIQGNGEDPDRETINPWYPNCDGFRVPAVPLAKASSVPWQAIAVMPSSTINVDLRVHEIMPPSRAYGEVLVSSSWEDTQTDFVVVDRTVAGTGAGDASVVKAGGSVGGYTITSVYSQALGAISPGDNVFGPFGMDGGGFLQLKDLQLEPGAYTVTLKPQTGDADMGITVFLPTTAGGSPFYSKDDGLDGAPMAFEQPAGQPETTVFELRNGEEGLGCLAIWKVGAADMDANQDFTIEISFTPAPAECIRIDGYADAAYGYSTIVQTVQTEFGDSDAGQVDDANGSELDQAFGKICDGTLYLTFTGNLETNFNDFELFLDTRSGGQNTLLGNNPVLGELDDLNRMGPSEANNQAGFTFDAGFSPDWWFTAHGGNGEAIEGGFYQLYVHKAELLTEGGGEGTFLGATVAGGRGLLRGSGGGIASPVRVAIDNSNTGGVTSGSGPDSGFGVSTGIEFAIPLSEIGDPTGCVSVLAFVNGKFHDFVSNQFLPPLGVAMGNLGEPRDVDLSLIPGTQYFTVCGEATGVDGETPPVRNSDVVLHAAAPNPFNPRTTLSFDLPRESSVELALYDVAGRRVRTFRSGERMAAGSHSFGWNGVDDDGRRVASGSYLLRLVADGETRVRRLTLLK